MLPILLKTSTSYNHHVRFMASVPKVVLSRQLEEETCEPTFHFVQNRELTVLQVEDDAERNTLSLLPAKFQKMLWVRRGKALAAKLAVLCCARDVMVVRLRISKPL